MLWIHANNHTHTHDVTAEGTEITAEHAVNCPVTAKVYGAGSKQAGNPSPEYPQEIMSSENFEVIREAGKNLLDKSNVTYGKYILGNGYLGINPIYCAFDYVEVIPGKTYTWHPSGGGDEFAFYDNDKNFVAMIDKATSSGTFVVPDNAKYMRGSTPIFRLNETRLEEGSTHTKDPSYDIYSPEQSVLIDQPLPCIELDPKSTGYYSYEKDGKRYLSDEIEIKDGKVTYVQNVNILDMSKNALFHQYKHSAIEKQSYYAFSYAFERLPKELRIKTSYIDTDGTEKIFGANSLMCTSLPLITYLWENDTNFAIEAGGGKSSFNGCLIFVFPKDEIDSCGTETDTVITKLGIWWSSLIDSGFTCTVQYIIEPIITDITDTELGQRLLTLYQKQGTTHIYTTGTTDDLKPIIHADIKVLGNDTTV